jgi:protein CWC15
VDQRIINDFYLHIRTSRLGRSTRYQRRTLHLTIPSQLGQGSETEARQRDLRAELLQAEAAHFAKKNGVPINEPVIESAAPKRLLEGGPLDGAGEAEEEDPETKRRRILEETRDIDADSEGSEDDSSEEER